MGLLLFSSEDFGDDSEYLNQSTIIQSKATFNKQKTTEESTQLFAEPIRTVQDIDRILDSIKQQQVVVAKPVEPIFHICLNLTIETVERELAEESEVNAEDEDGKDDEDEGKTRATGQTDIDVGFALSPKADTFKNYFKDLIDCYEQTAGI